MLDLGLFARCLYCLNAAGSGWVVLPWVIGCSLLAIGVVCAFVACCLVCWFVAGFVMCWFVGASLCDYYDYALWFALCTFILPYFWVCFAC